MEPVLGVDPASRSSHLVGASLARQPRSVTCEAFRVIVPLRRRGNVSPHTEPAGRPAGLPVCAGMTGRPGGRGQEFMLAGSQHASGKMRRAKKTSRGKNVSGAEQEMER